MLIVRSVYNVLLCIDIDIVIPPEQEIGQLVLQLQPLGYTHLGNLGIAGRDVFRQENALPTHHIEAV